MVKIANVYDALVEVVYKAMRQVHQDHERIAREGPNFLDCYAQGTVAEILDVVIAGEQGPVPPKSTVLIEEVIAAHPGLTTQELYVKVNELAAAAALRETVAGMVHVDAGVRGVDVAVGSIR